MNVAFVAGSRAILLLIALQSAAIAQTISTDQFLNDVAAAELIAQHNQIWLDTSAASPVLRIYDGMSWRPCRRTSDSDVWLCIGTLVNVRTGNIVNLPPEFMRGDYR